MRRPIAALTTAIATLALSLTAGCSATSAPHGTGSSPGAAHANQKVIKITFSGGRVTPIAEQVSVQTGQTVVLDITADTAGEIHVHSTPEQHIDYQAGETEAPLTALRIPGTIEIESHSLEKTILILQVH